jgi:hypothetical protein
VTTIVVKSTTDNANNRNCCINCAASNLEKIFEKGFVTPFACKSFIYHCFPPPTVVVLVAAVVVPVVLVVVELAPLGNEAMDTNDRRN